MFKCNSTTSLLADMPIIKVTLSWSLQVVRQLLIWAFPHFASLRDMYLQGLHNLVADFLSQKPEEGFWEKSHLEVVEEIRPKYDMAELDLFASGTSTHCPAWFSLIETTNPLGQCILVYPWPEPLLYPFPLFPLIAL